jgi:hypothetical protein
MTADSLMTINPLQDDRWDPFVDAHPDSSVYLHSAWLRVLASSYPHVRPVAYVKVSEGRLKAALPVCAIRSRVTGNRQVSLPFTPYCNPLVERESDAADLLEGPIRATAGGATFYELRTLGAVPGIGGKGLKCHDYHMTHILDLQAGFEGVQRNISSNIITNKKRAVKAGVTIRPAVSEADWKTFHAIHAVTRRKQGFPIQPYSFFANMRRFLEPGNKVRILLAELKGLPIAGIVLFQYRETMSYEIGASLPEFLEERPNHLLLWTAVESACAQGRKFFDFGKSPPDNPGLVEFKRRWGAERRDCPYYYFPEVAGVMAVEQNSLNHRAMRLLLSRAPLSVAKLLSRGLYRHLG